MQSRACCITCCWTKQSLHRHERTSGCLNSMQEDQLGGQVRRRQGGIAGGRAGGRQGGGRALLPACRPARAPAAAITVQHNSSKLGAATMATRP